MIATGLIYSFGFVKEIFVLGRIGYDHKIHPSQLQLRCCSFHDPQGIQNRSSVTLNLKEGIITNYYTEENRINTKIRECIASDDNLAELYSFFTLDAIEKFEKIPGKELESYATGYYDLSSLRYFLIRENGSISDGVRHYAEIKEDCQ